MAREQIVVCSYHISLYLKELQQATVNNLYKGKQSTWILEMKLFGLSLNVKVMAYKGLEPTVLEYASSVWDL